MHLRLHIHVTMIVIFCESRSMNSHYKLSMRAAEYFYIVLTNWQVTNLKRKNVKTSDSTYL